MKENLDSLHSSSENLDSRVFNLFELNYRPETFKTISGHIKSGKLPLIVANHQSHADGLILSLITEKIKDESPDNINGFYLPIASSMVSGKQSPNLKKYLELLAPLCEHNNLFMIPVTRKKDIEVYGEENPNFSSIRKILNCHNDKFGMIFLPEGSVQSGRNREDGSIFGTIPPEENNSFDDLVKKYLKNNIDFCVIPVAINGTYKFCNPTTYKIDMFCSDISATISDNILTSDDFKDLKNKPSEFIMPLVAGMLPVESRGVYKQNV